MKRLKRRRLERRQRQQREAPEEEEVGCLGEIVQGEATTEGGGERDTRTEWQRNEKRDEGEERECVQGS